MISICFSIIAIIFFINKTIKIEISSNLLKFFDAYYVILFIIASILMLGISYLISRKIYLKKEII